MHRAGLQASRLLRSSRDEPGRRVPPPARGGPAISFPPSQDPGPQDLTPRRARVTIREIPRPAPRRWRIRWIDVITVLLVAAAATALLVR